MQANPNHMNDFDWAGKGKQPASKMLRVWTKKNTHLKIFMKILRFFDKNLYGKLIFSQFFTTFFLAF